ncbi:SDR family NAD(P)-dependent oxidoreductase [Bacillus safensis]|uniref:SDR family NAD(P)-dependent oxidoreductase n=1 Tax=Bacillus safensis TaxID=561879 RepID=UPI0018E0FAA3|nr:SDR family oxidoreductase [Bacillus safensis]MBI1630697.1 SDR family oxidoreductase [Bacillus safensis]
MNFFDFSKKNILITGASSDIATTIALGFSELGGNIILSDLPSRQTKLKLIKSKIFDKFNNKIDILLIDFTDINDIKRKIHGYKKNVDILINCAGNNIFRPALKVSEEDWDTIIDVNLKGTFFLSQSIAVKMQDNKKGGKIINIGSQHGVVANGLRAPYCVSKFGLIGMTKVLALELSIYNILVNCVSPTYVETTKSKDFLAHEDVQKAFLSKIPLNQYAKPQDISYVVMFLSSDHNKMITGENIMVDGGYTIH